MNYSQGVGMDIEERTQFYLSHFEKQKSSGLGVKAYCKANGISDCSFYSWRKRLKQEDTLSLSGEITSNKSKRINFTPLSLSSIHPPSSSPYTIEFSSGIRFSINSVLSCQELSYLLTTLKDS